MKTLETLRWTDDDGDSGELRDLRSLADIGLVAELEIGYNDGESTWFRHGSVHLSPAQLADLRAHAGELLVGQVWQDDDGWWTFDGDRLLGPYAEGEARQQAAPIRAHNFGADGATDQPAGASDAS